MNIKPQRLIVPLCVLLLSTALTPPSPQGTLVDKVIARVNDKIVLHSELLIACQQYLAQGGQDIPNLKCKLLEHILLSKLMVDKAQSSGITVNNEEVQQEVQQKMQYLIAQAGSEQTLVQHWGKPLSDIRMEVEEKLREQLVVDKMRAQIIKNITITPQEVKEFFETLPPQERPYYPAEVEIRQIVKYPTISQQEIGRLTEQLKALKGRIQNGESFEKLASQHSQDPGSAPQGGELGFWRLGELAPAYEATALALKPGEISDPVATQFGLHLIQLIAHEKDQYNSRHILLKPDPQALDIDAAKAQLAQLRTEIMDGKITFVKAAQDRSDDMATSTVGGLLTGSQGSARMSVDKLPSELFFAIEQLTPNAISEPLVFTTPDNQKAVHLLYLKDRIPPRQATLVQDYDKLQQLVINEKRANALQNWFNDTKASTSIYVAPAYQQCELLK